MADYYDVLLAAIAAAVLLGGAASVHPAVRVHQGLAAGSLVATVFLFEVLFRNPPSESRAARSRATYVVGAGWVLTLVSFL